MDDTATAPISSRDAIAAGQGRRPGDGHYSPRYCGWCGVCLATNDSSGRKRRYCGQSCRQRAYERRVVVQRNGLPDDAVILSQTEVVALQDRLFQLRCAAEDIATAADDRASQTDLRELGLELARAAKDLEQLR